MPPSPAAPSSSVASTSPRCAANTIENDCDEQPAFASPDISEISGPLLIRSSCFKLPVQQIRRNRVQCSLKLPRGTTAFVSCFDTSDLYQTSHTILTAYKASIHKVAHYAWRAVCTIAGFVAVLDGLWETKQWVSDHVLAHACFGSFREYLDMATGNNAKNKINWNGHA